MNKVPQRFHSQIPRHVNLVCLHKIVRQQFNFACSQFVFAVLQTDHWSRAR